MVHFWENDRCRKAHIFYNHMGRKRALLVIIIYNPAHNYSDGVLPAASFYCGYGVEINHCRKSGDSLAVIFCAHLVHRGARGRCVVSFIRLGFSLGMLALIEYVCLMNFSPSTA